MNTCECGHDEDEHNGDDGGCDECECEFFEPAAVDPDEAKVVFD